MSPRRPAPDVVIRSPQHPALKEARRLEADAGARRKERRAIAWGRHLALEAFAAGLAIERALMAPDLEKDSEGNRIAEAIEQARTPALRVPVVDTSNPFIARWIPTPDESMLVIRFANPRGIDFPYLLSMIHDSFMSRANSIVVPGNKLDLAMQLILTPLILQLIERKNRVS